MGFHYLSAASSWVRRRSPFQQDIDADDDVLGFPGYAKFDVS